jgi:hypothetical protein
MSTHETKKQGWKTVYLEEDFLTPSNIKTLEVKLFYNKDGVIENNDFCLTIKTEKRTFKHSFGFSKEQFVKLIDALATGEPLADKFISDDWRTNIKTRFQ